jgi:hypothetical protein
MQSYLAFSIYDDDAYEFFVINDEKISQEYPVKIPIPKWIFEEVEEGRSKEEEKEGRKEKKMKREEQGEGKLAKLENEGVILYYKGSGYGVIESNVIEYQESYSEETDDFISWADILHTIYGIGVKQHNEDIEDEEWRVDDNFDEGMKDEEPKEEGMKEEGMKEEGMKEEPKSDA